MDPVEQVHFGADQLLDVGIANVRALNTTFGLAAKVLSTAVQAPGAVVSKASLAAAEEIQAQVAKLEALLDTDGRQVLEEVANVGHEIMPGGQGN